MAINDPGFEYRELLTKQKRPSDISSIKKYYKENELTPRFGEWVGSQTQYNALKNNLNVEIGLEDAKRKLAAIQSQAGQMFKIKEAGIPVDVKSTQFAPTKEFANVFPELSKDIPEGAYRIGETGKPEYYGLPDPGKDEGIWKSVTPEYLEKQPGYVPPSATPQPTGTTLKTPTLTSVPETPNVPVPIQNVQLNEVDIGDIIGEIEAGTLSSPEIVIGQEVAQRLTEEEKSKASQALSNIQQNMAKSGMAFSGIRTAAEESAAAASLSKLSGINLDLASKIVSAARQEQNRRIQAIQTQQNAANTALKAMGYTINPLDGSIVKTLERERFEEPEQPRYFSSKGSFFQFDPITNEMVQLYQASEEENNLNIHFFTDENGEATKVVSDPITGKELFREKLGKIGRTGTDFDLPPGWETEGGQQMSADDNNFLQNIIDWGWKIIK